ncbi:Holliday junction branch migration protein RuvA, partial [Capnocytophaga sp. oral taxon 338]|uniref:Holliday junction branch migration protein RuvA n=1 Tax=Capnocytophaga sp. oral taxon 338 TaxID=710239 RepID=UPI000202F7DA
KSENNLAFGNPPAPKPTLVLEANTATASHFEEGRKAKIHGLITVKGSSTYFKFKDGTEIQIYTDNFNNISQGTKDKLKQEGYELTATGTFRTKGTVKRLVYESKNDLAFGNPPAPKPTLVLEANTATASHFEEGRKAKIHGLITVKGSSTYFKFKDGTEIQIYTDNFNNISQGIKDKLATEDYELTATGTFRTKGTIKRLVYESENDLAFGNPPAPKPTLEIEASTATINQFEENREAKIHGNITVKNGNSYFKFQDGTLIQIFAYKSVKEAFSAEEKKKFTTEGQELTVTGTFVTYNGIKEIKVTKKENVIFGNTPTPTPPTQGNIFDFEDLPTGTASYTETGTLNGADGVTLKYVARTDVDKYGIQGKGLILFNKKPSNNTYIEITFPKGVKDFSFEYREAFGKGNRHFVIYEGEEGNSKKLDEKTFKNISTKETYSKTLNKSGSYTLTIKPAQGSKQFVIDNIKWTK